MKKKPLSYYLDLMKSAQDKRDWIKAKHYGEIALKKLSRLSYSSREEYVLYMELGSVYHYMAEYSRSLDIFNKAFLVASTQNFPQSDVYHASYMMGLNLKCMNNINQALNQFKKVEKYYQQYGHKTLPMDNKKYVCTLIYLGECHLFKEDFKKAKELIEKKIPVFLQSLPDDVIFIDYYLMKGEYRLQLKEYSQARQSFQECIKIAGQLKEFAPLIEAKINLAVIDLLEGHIETSIQALKSILKDAKRLNFNDYVYSISFLLSKCYYLKNLPDRAVFIEKRAKRFLNKLDILWLYEISRDIEQIYRQLQNIYQTKTSFHYHTPESTTNILKEQYESLERKYLVIGKSKEMLELYNLIENIAPTDLPILIQGETGTGKELVAHSIHNNSLRKEYLCLAINCGAIPETLLENELFGHAKSAFTDAGEDKKGYIELASKGTLFLDEISEMSPAMQQKLLRVLEEKQVWRLGAEKHIPVNTRFIFASNQDVEELVKRKLFRQDLFYRINTIVITLPPLRDRKEDIPLLVNHFLNKYFRPSSIVSTISSEALSLFVNYPWSGNVRELENEMERICVLNPNVSIITKEMLSKTIRNYKYPLNSRLNMTSLKEARQSAEKNLIIDTIKKSNCNLTQSARLLGCSRRYLHRKIKQLKINPAIIFVTK